VENTSLLVYTIFCLRIAKPDEKAELYWSMGINEPAFTA
jgi:hypothetical protein